MIIATGTTDDDNLVEPGLLEALEKIRRPKSGMLGTLMILVVSVAAFFALGLLRDSIVDIALLIGVLFFHECGHFVGMRLFGYSDVKMFFIPLFGAAVSGQKIGVEGYKEGIVALLGPMPGILLGLGLGAASIVMELTAVRSLAIVLLVLNMFNLLPVLPLDGGRVMDIILFSRNRFMEVLFRLWAAVALAVLGVLLEAWLLAGLALFLLMGIARAFRTSTIARSIRDACPLAPADPSGKIPIQAVAAILHHVTNSFPALPNHDAVAGVITEVWRKVHMQPADPVSAILLLIAYGFTFVVGSIGILAVVVAS